MTDVPLIAVVIGSSRTARFADAPAGWLLRRAAQRSDIRVEVIDIRDHLLPAYDEQLPPARAPREYSTPELAAFGSAVDRADGFVVFTPEYNHGYPAPLKNALDHTFVEWRRKPVSFIGWGGVGGARAIEQLRQVFVEFESAPLRHAVHILPDAMGAIREGIDPDLALDALTPKLDLLLDDLVWWTSALRSAREYADAA